MKYSAEVTLNFSSSVIGNSNEETNFPYKLLLNETQDSRLRKAFANNSSANTKSSKTQLSIIEKSGGILGSALGLLLKSS